MFLLPLTLVEAVSNHVRPHWPKEAMTASDSEDPGGAERLRVETKVNVELHQENKHNHVGERGETPQGRETPTRENGPLSLPSNGPPSLGTHQPEPKKGERCRHSIFYLLLFLLVG